MSLSKSYASNSYFLPTSKWCFTGVAALNVRKSAFDALKKGFGALGKVKLSPPHRRPLKNSMKNECFRESFRK